MVGVTFLACLSLAADVSAARITLRGHRGELDLSTGTPHLRFELSAQSSLPVAVREVEVGILFASDEAALKDIDAGKLYQSDAVGGRKVGALRERVAVEIAARGEVRLTINRLLAQGEPEPRAFRTHVLGYRLTALSAPLLFELMDSAAAADEVAVVGTLALSGTAVEKRAVRAKWAQTPGLVPALLDHATSDPGPAPSHDVTLRRVFAVRALGVMGGDEAVGGLKGLLRDPRLAAFDEPLQVLRVARLVGSPLETPMAYAVPPEARRMHDVVAAALDDAVGPRDTAPAAKPVAAQSATEGALEDAEPRGAGAAAGEGSAAGEEAPRALVITPRWLWAALVGAAAFLLLVGVFRMLRHRPTRPPRS